MKTTKVQCWKDIPENYTGIAEFPNGTKSWWYNGKCHREDGPAVEWADGDKWWCKNGLLHREDGPAKERTNGTKHWCLEGDYYEQLNPKDFVVLDHYQGKYNLIWYKILDKDEIFDCPDIPGLIEK